MPTYEDLMAKRGESKAEQKAKREERDVAELQKLLDDGILADETAVLVRFPDAPPDLPGHYVGRCPSQAVAQKFRHTMWQDSSKAGIVEAKSKAGAQMASQCRMYPDETRYAALVAAFPMVPDRISQALIKAAEAGADQEGKD